MALFIGIVKRSVCIILTEYELQYWYEPATKMKLLHGEQSTYIRQVMKYRKNGAAIYYLNET